MVRVVALVLCFVVGGCSQLGGVQAISCGSDDAKAAVESLVQDALLKQSRTLIAMGDSTATSSQLRSATTQTKVALTDVRTSQDDPNSTKQFCAATIKITLPDTAIQRAEEALSLAGGDDVETVAAQFDVDKKLNGFSSAFEYSVQPTDDGSSVFAEADGDLPIVNALSQIVVASFQTENLRNAKAAERAADAQAEREARQVAEEEDAAFVEQGAAYLAEAKAENEMANQRINGFWNAMTSTRQKELRPLQRAWIARRTADCKVEAAGTSPAASIRMANQLRCETRLSGERQQWLMENSGYE